MNLDKAIEILILDGHENPKEPFCDLEKATKLGIEALKRFKEVSAWPHEYLRGPLPGETDD